MTETTQAPETITAQEVFDEVAAALFKQGKQAVTEGGQCMYRAPDGSKCAVGHLIPDENYDERWELETVDHHKVVEMLPEKYRAHTDLLGWLQMVHDDKRSWDSPEVLRAALAEQAKRFDLNTAALNGRTFGA